MFHGGWNEEQVCRTILNRLQTAVVGFTLTGVFFRSYDSIYELSISGEAYALFALTYD